MSLFICLSLSWKTFIFIFEQGNKPFLRKYLVPPLPNDIFHLSPSTIGSHMLGLALHTFNPWLHPFIRPKLTTYRRGICNVVAHSGDPQSNTLLVIELYYSQHSYFDIVACFMHFNNNLIILYCSRGLDIVVRTRLDTVWSSKYSQQGHAASWTTDQQFSDGGW